MILACMHAKQLKRKTNKQMLSAQIKKNAISLVSCVQIFQIFSYYFAPANHQNAAYDKHLFVQHKS